MIKGWNKKMIFYYISDKYPATNNSKVWHNLYIVWWELHHGSRTSHVVNDDDDDSMCTVYK